MGQPNDRRKYLVAWAVAGVICLAAGAVWAGGVVYVGGHDESNDAFLGVTLTEEIDNPEGGARVLGVIDDSPAEQAGLEEGDIIQGLDGEVVRGPGALSKRLEGREPGDQVSIRLIRDGREMTLDVELGERSDLGRWHVRNLSSPGQLEQFEHLGEWAEEFGEKFGGEFSEKWTEWADELDDSIYVTPHHGRLSSTYFLRSWGRPKLGVQLSETTPELREHFGADDDSGVLISKVLPDTPAADAGLRVGDLIVAIDGEPVSSSGEIVDELRDKEDMTFPVDVIRDGRSVSIDVTIPEREERQRNSGPRAFYVRPALPAMPAMPAPAPAGGHFPNPPIPSPPSPRSPPDQSVPRRV